MKFLDYFYLAIVNLKRNKKMFIKNTFLISISLCLLLSSNITTSSIKNVMDISIKYNTCFRTIYVQNKDNMEISQFLENLEKIEHIQKVIKQGEYRINVDVVSVNGNTTSGRMNLIGSNKEISPLVIKGTKIEDGENDVCIIPKKLYLGDISETIKEEDIIDGEKLLNKEIVINYYKYDYSKNVPTREKTYEKKLKVIGIYDTDENMGDINECYTSFETVSEINNILVEDIDNEENYVLAIIDNYDNIENVFKELNNKEYKYFLYSEPNSYLINIINITCQVIALSILVLVVINIIINSIRESKDRTKEIGLLRALGYTKKNIWKIRIVETVIWTIVSFIITCIFTIIIVIILSIIIKNGNAEIQKIRIIINFLPFLIYFLILFLLLIVVNLISSVQIINSSIINNSKE